MNAFVNQHLALPYLVRRHRLFGPWSRGSVLLHLSYITVNVFLVFFGDSSLTSAGRRAGSLALINLTFLLSAMHLSFLADCLGITLRDCKRLHRAVGWTAVNLQAFHIAVAVLVSRVEFPILEPKNLAATIAAASLGILAILAFPWFRRYAYEIFLRAHQILVGVYVYGVLRHLPRESQSPRLCIYVALGIFGLTSLLQSMTFLYRNGLFAGRGSPRAIVSYSQGEKARENSDDMSGSVIKMQIIIPRSVKVEAGQYINLWMPTVSLWSWAQTHPFTVTSWSRGKQDSLDLFVQPRRGHSLNLLRHVRMVTEGSVSFLALFTGPHGISERVGGYESALVVASGFGIAAVIPYIRQMIYGYNTCTSQIRRIHLVWQVESMDIAIAAQKLLNSLLVDDVMDDGYILNLSIYMEKDQLVQSRLPFGKHERAFLYQGTPDYRNIISSEASGDLIERLPNIRDKRGETLVMVSVTDGIRDHIREVTREYLHERVNFMELEYQPSF